MSLLYEQEIRDDLERKTLRLAGLEHKLRGWTASHPVPITELTAALEEARAVVRDSAVVLENHFSGLIPLAPETLGDTILVLRAADGLVARVIEALTPRG